MRFEIVFFYLLLITYGCSPSKNIVVHETKENKLGAHEKLNYFLKIADSLRIKANVPGVGIAIVHDHEILYTGGLGYRNIKKKLPVTKNTLFAIGSTTKAFTGVLAAKLVEKDLLEWDEPIINHFKDLKLKEDYITKSLTIEDALTHISGLGRYDHIWKGSKITKDQILDTLKYLDFHNSFRQKKNYNNLMYLIAGATTEHISNKTWDTQLKENIFEPLQMKNSFSDYNGFINYNEKSIGYKADGTTSIPHLDIDNMGPAGSISSTPIDIANWLKMLVNKGIFNQLQFLHSREYNFITNPNTRITNYINPTTFEYYAIGFGGRIEDGIQMLAHDGGIDGQNAYTFLIPSKGFGIFIMTNQISQYKNLLAFYADNIFIKNNYARDFKQEEVLVANVQFSVFEGLLATKSKTEALTYYYQLKNRKFEDQMNALGYYYLRENKLDTALMLLELNAEENPASFNAFDSLGEAFFLKKQYAQAYKHYRKSLELNKDNGNARAMILKISKLINEN